MTGKTIFFLHTQKGGGWAYNLQENILHCALFSFMWKIIYITHATTLKQKVNFNL